MWTSLWLALDPLKSGFRHQARGGDWTLGRHPGVSATARKQTEGREAEETREGPGWGGPPREADGGMGGPATQRQGGGATRTPGG